MREISEKVENVLINRKPTFHKCNEIGKILENIKPHLAEFRNLINLLPDKQDLENKSNEIYIQAEELITLTSKLKVRFNRGTLNIGVIGMARQGKSTLLQNLTGLSNNEIPSGNLDNCTGSMSIIEHLNIDEPYAEISFYSKDEYLNSILKPYYNSLDLGNLESLTHFEIHNIPNLSEKLKGNIEKDAEFSHLLKLKQSFENYKNLLDQPKKRVTKAEIRSYIAQDDTNGNRVYYNYLAVKEAKIYCKYPQIDVSKVALCDTPGLGQTGVGHEEGLINIISKDLDFILFLKLPPSTGAIWAKQTDIKLHSIVSNGVKTIPINEWSMYVLNKKHDNQVQAEHLKSTMVEHGIKAVECIVADCNDPEEAREKILIPVLEYLSSNILKLDNIYLTSYFQDLKRFNQDLNNLINESDKTLKKTLGSENIDDKLSKLLKDFERELKVKLNELVENMRNNLGKYDPLFINLDRNNTGNERTSFLEDIEILISECEKSPQIPSEEEIKIIRKTKGSLVSAYDEAMHIMRSNLSNRFLNIEEKLEKYIENMKIKVGKTFLETKLKNFIKETPENEIVNFLYTSIDPSQHELKEAFKILNDFKLSFRGLIQHRIRKNFHVIYPDTTRKTLRESIKDEKDAFVALNSLYEEVLSKCHQSLKNLATEPDLAIFAIVEEFEDRAIRSIDKDLDLQWQSFIREIKSEIWPDEFKKFEEKTRERKAWNNCQENLKKEIENIKKLLDN